MNLDTLRSLQTRIREATGPDRELDAAIFAALNGGTATREHVGFYTGWVLRVHIGRRVVSDFPSYTASLDACVALQSEVLPGYRRNSIETQTGEWLLALFGEVHVIEDRHALETHAHLLAIFAAVIAREEAKETEKTG